MWNKTISCFNKNQIYSSLVMPNAYFNTALILIDYISKDSEDGEFGGRRPDIWKKYDDDMKEMLNPLLYNLKHWIELSCKTFLNLWKNEFDKGHNIKFNFCKFKCLCLELNYNKEIELNEIDLEEINKIETLISDLYNNDDKNDEYRYPNTKNFSIHRKTGKTYEYSIKIPNLCNNWKTRENSIECIEKIKSMIIELWNFFENIWKKKYFEKKIKEKV